MQESAPVGFDPMYEGQLPWSTRLFVMYLIVVLLVSCFRAVRLVWDLRSLRKAGREATAQLNYGFLLGMGLLSCKNSINKELVSADVSAFVPRVCLEPDRNVEGNQRAKSDGSGIPRGCYR